MKYALFLLSICFSVVAFAQSGRITVGRLNGNKLEITCDMQQLRADAQAYAETLLKAKVYFQDFSIKTYKDAMNGEVIYALVAIDKGRKKSMAVKMAARLDAPDGAGTIYAPADGIFSNTCVCQGCFPGCEPERKDSNWICTGCKGGGKKLCKKTTSITVLEKE